MPLLAGLLRLAASLLALVIALALPAVAAEAPAVVVVFDGSGSMWGKIGTDPNPKHVTAREALRQALSSIDRSTLVGLTVLGHRRPGDCTDVELMLPLAPVDAERITAPLVKLNPKGRGPLALALRRTVQALPGTGPESIVILHDDPDNCQEDPCAAAAEIHRQKPRLTIHVVSFGMKPEDFERMSCVAKTTGGRWFDVQSPAAAQTAIGEALRLASLAGPAAGAGLPVPAPKPAVRPAETGPPGLRLGAILAPGGELVARPVQWRIWRGGTTTGPLAAELTEATPAVTLDPGSYMVEARLGLASATQAVEVAGDRPTRVTLSLNAGVIQLGAAAFSHPSPTAILTLAAHEQGTMADRVLWIGPAEASELVVPAGSYKVLLQDRQFRSEKMIVVPSGSQGTAVIAPQAGRIRLDARDYRGEALSGLVLYRVLEDDPTAPSGRREIARSASPKPEFLLPAGTYHVSARRGSAEVRELVALGAGDEVTRTLVLGSARLSLSARLAGAARPAEMEVSYRIVRAEDSSEIARADGPDFELELPAGRYRIESRIGEQNAVTSRDVEMRAGTDQSVVISHAAGRVELKLAGAGAAAASAETFWEIQDQTGRTVWRTIGAEPRGVLAAGRYVARIETRERRREKAFEIRAGENSVVEIGVE